MSADAKRDWLQGEIDKRTARIEGKIAAPGKFVVNSTSVLRFRLLLSKDMLAADAPVEVTTNDKPARYAATPSRLVALRDFVERFDRTFIPVVEVSCP
jgi:hypothetical protein